MSADSQPGRGILKNYRSPQSSSNSRVRPTRSDPRDVALQHAEILQHRKNIEAQILDSVIELSTYPLVRTEAHSAANPAAQDVIGFREHVRLFQPSDYDDLVTERNANGLCGYTLCSRPKLKATPGGMWKLVNLGKKDFDIVNRKDHERWCSEICAKRAFYIKVQLNETAAWEREESPDLNLELYEEEETSMTRLAKEEERRKENEKRRDAQLALERGDGPDKKDLIKVAIRPKEVRPPINESTTVSFDSESHLRVEGYKPKSQGKEAASNRET